MFKNFLTKILLFSEKQSHVNFEVFGQRKASQSVTYFPKWTFLYNNQKSNFRNRIKILKAIINLAFGIIDCFKTRIL